MTKKIYFGLALFLLVIPITLAFDCSQTSDKSYCQSIKDSNLDQSEKDTIFSFLLYRDNDYPDHNFVWDYNKKVKITPTITQNSQYIKNAWVKLLAISPSVYENNTLYVPPNIKVLSEYNYKIQTPSNYKSPRYPQARNIYCEIKHDVRSKNQNLRYYHNGNYKDQGKSAKFSINNDGLIKAELTITAQIRSRYYQWKEYRFWRWTWHRCEKHHTNYYTDSITIQDSKNVSLYTKQPLATLTVTNEYQGTTKGNFSAQDYSTFTLKFKDSEYQHIKKYYGVIFDNNYIATLRSRDKSEIKLDNIHVENNKFYVRNTQKCKLEAYNHFYNFQSDCDLTLQQEIIEKLEVEKNKQNIKLLVHLAIFLLVFYLFFKILKSQTKKFILPILSLISIPFVSASSHSAGCSLSNLGQCLAENFFQYILAIFLSGPLVPLLILVEKLLTATVSVGVFFNLWNIIRYLLGFFYIFFFLYSGYVILTGNNNPIKRAHAKEMLQNTIFMIILINASFYVYELVLSLSAMLNSSIIGMIEPTFFLLTADNIVNLGLQFIFSFFYGITLFFTLLMLTLRYAVVSFGVVLLPIALFLFFIPPLKGYGKLILEILGIFIFITFIDLLIILGSSSLLNVSVFANIKILVMITCFLLINYTLWLAIKFALKKSANVNLKDDLNKAVKYIAMIV